MGLVIWQHRVEIRTAHYFTRRFFNFSGLCTNSFEENQFLVYITVLEHNMTGTLKYYGQISLSFSEITFELRVEIHFGELIKIY